MNDGDDALALRPNRPAGSRVVPTITTTTATLWDEAAAVLSGLIGGGRYGLKIRVPHAFVMTFLFGSRLSFVEKLRVVARLAAEHASNLAVFACLYKLILASLKVLSRRMDLVCGGSRLGTMRELARSLLSVIVGGPFSCRKHIASPASSGAPPGLPERTRDAFVAGAVGGYLVWGRYSGVNYQLVLYLASRVAVACLQLAREKGLPPLSWRGMSFDRAYPMAAAGIWGTVMALFEARPDVLHPSLRRSMEEIYRYAAGFG